MAGETGIVIAGYRGRVPSVRELVAAIPETSRLQFLRADRVYGRDHLVVAARAALRAFERGRAKGGSLPVEAVRYAAGERQIGKALSLLGLQPGESREIAALGFGDDASKAMEEVAARFGWVRDDGVVRARDDALDTLGIPLRARGLLPRARWGDLVIERVALADLLK